MKLSSQVILTPKISSAESTALETQVMQTTALYSFAWNHSSLQHRCRATTHWHAALRRWPGPTCGDGIGASEATSDLQGLGIQPMCQEFNHHLEKIQDLRLDLWQWQLLPILP